MAKGWTDDLNLEFIPLDWLLTEIKEMPKDGRSDDGLLAKKVVDFWDEGEKLRVWGQQRRPSHKQLRNIVWSSRASV